MSDPWPLDDSPDGKAGLTELRYLSRRLAALVNEPEPGLASWHLMLGGVLRAIGRYAPAKENE